MTSTEQTNTTIDQFISATGVTMTCKMVDRNPHMDNSERMDHWRCFLRVTGRRMQVVFSKGMGHHGAEPTVDEVLDCLASDASGFENARDFEDWCADYGYDTDSRKAEHTYRTIERQAASLKRLLGDGAYDTLLWHTDRA